MATSATPAVTVMVYVSDKVTAQKVTFKNQCGLEVAGNPFVPNGQSGGSLAIVFDVLFVAILTEGPA